MKFHESSICILNNLTLINDNKVTGVTLSTHQVIKNIKNEINKLTEGFDFVIRKYDPLEKEFNILSTLRSSLRTTLTSINEYMMIYNNRDMLVRDSQLKPCINDLQDSFNTLQNLLKEATPCLLNDTYNIL